MSTWWAYLQALAERDLGLAVALFSCVFLVKHTFCLPGGTLLNALGGALFGPMLAVPLCASLSACGACTCFLVSRACGAPLIARWQLEPYLAPLRRRVDDATAKGVLPRAMLSLRLVPFLPQWTVTVGAPHAGIPLPLLVWTTGVGLIPYCFFTCMAGVALAAALKPGDDGSSISTTSLVSPRAIALLCAGAAAIAFGPPAMERLARCVDREPGLPFTTPVAPP